METSISNVDPTARPEGSLTPDAALRYAWWSWLVFLLVPFLVFLFVGHSLGDDSIKPDPHLAGVWFLVSVIYLGIAVPGAIFWRSRLFRAYWHGDPVLPRDYLAGMIGMWFALEIGGILSLVGCFESHQLLPCLLPAMVAFVLFTPLWPAGHAMTRHTGNQDDPQYYKEPR